MAQDIFVEPEKMFNPAKCFLEHQRAIDRDVPSNFTTLPTKWTNLATVAREACWFRHALAPKMVRLTSNPNTNPNTNPNPGPNTNTTLTLP